MLTTKRHWAGALIGFLLLVSFTTTAAAVSWTEVGDAGDTPLTAQTPIGVGALDAIVGTLSPANDTDVFRIYIPNPNLFAITMNGTNLTGDDDMELYVLDEAGNLVFNDDDGGPGWLSQVNPGALAGQPGGIYLIAYNLFSSYPLNGQLNPVTGWTVNPFSSQTGTVQLNLTGAEFAPQFVASTQAVPEPGSLLLLALGLAGLAARRFGRQRP